MYYLSTVDRKRSTMRLTGGFDHLFATRARQDQTHIETWISAYCTRIVHTCSNWNDAKSDSIVRRIWCGSSPRRSGLASLPRGNHKTDVVRRLGRMYVPIRNVAVQDTVCTLYAHFYSDLRLESQRNRWMVTGGHPPLRSRIFPSSETLSPQNNNGDGSHPSQDARHLLFLQAQAQGTISHEEASHSSQAALEPRVRRPPTVEFMPRITSSMIKPFFHRARPIFPRPFHCWI